jgi:hypothetical protein
MALLFVTSGYWSPVQYSQLDPAIGASLGTDNYGRALVQYIPTLIPLIDRPWADFWSSDWFSSFNVTKWEEDSLRLAIEVEKAKEHAQEKVVTDLRQKPNSTWGKITNETQSPADDALEAFRQSWSSMIDVIKSPRYFVTVAWSHFSTRRHQNPSAVLHTNAAHEQPPTIARVVEDKDTESCWRPFCGSIDLRPYGIGMIFDLSIPKNT